MAVSVSEGKLIRLVDVPHEVKWLPKSRNGATRGFGALYAWTRSGLKNESGRIIKLETIRVGESLCTNEAALIRFFERLSAGDSDQDTATESQRKRASDAAQAKLAAMGV